MLSLLVLGYAGYLGLIFMAQRKMAFPGTERVSPRATPTPPPRGEQVWLEASFGRVEAWFVPPVSDGVRPAVIFTHGNGELIEDWASSMDGLAAGGIGVLLLEFPGYGHSGGSPSRASIREVSALAFDWLAARPDVDGTRIVAWGRSLGGGAAGDLSADRPIGALVLLSTFSSAAAVARQSLAPAFLVRDRFDNVGAVRAYSGPVLLMHGRSDEVLPFRHAERIAEARDDVAITEIRCGHNDCGRIWPEIVAEVLSFLHRTELLP
jgi:fermentation-respiration switch protein FrsA (DUF1100 family)